MNSNLVSIIIPTYNSEDFIEETITSCLEQTYSEVEVIVIDDASKDSTVRVIKRNFADKLELIENEANQGLSVNVNHAVKKCNGSYILILGHDDILPNDHLDKMTRHFHDEEVGLVHCNALQFDSSGNYIKLSRETSLQVRKTEKPSTFLIRGNFIQSCGMIIKKSYFDQVGGWDESYKLFGEWLLYTKLAKICSFKFACDCLPLYRVHKESTIRFLLNNRMRELNSYKVKCMKSALSNQSTIDKYCFYVLSRLKLSFISFRIRYL
ncbi:MAG: glycosyltransferase [Paraglaciecola sp.]